MTKKNIITKSLFIFLLFFVLFATGLSLLLHPLETYNPSHGIYLELDPDSILYRKFLEQSIEQQKVIKYDKYNCYPDIFPVGEIFPPLYLPLLVYTCWLYYSFFPDSNAIPEFVVGTLPVIAYSLLYVLIIWHFWNSTHNIGFCILLGLFLISNFGIQHTFKFLNLDHHWLENFCIWIQILLLVKYINTQNKKWLFISIISCTTLIGIWNGSPLYFGIMLIYASYQWLFAEDKTVTNNLLDFLYSTFITSGLIILIYTLVNIEHKLPLFRIDIFSYFHILFPIVSGLYLYLCKNLYNIDFYKKIILIISIVLLFVSVISSNIIEGFHSILVQVQNFFGKKTYFFRTVKELAPAVTAPFISMDNFLHYFKIFGLWIVLAPFTLIYFSSTIFNKTDKIIRDFSILFFILSLYQYRYIRWLTFGTGILAAFSYYIVFEKLWKSIVYYNYKKIYFILLLYPIVLFQNVVNFYNFSPYSYNSYLTEVTSWLYKKTPPTSGYSDDKTPEYGILCFWDKGNYIAFLARRPPIASNTMWGYRKMAEFFTSESEKEAYNLFKKYKVRYFLLSLDGLKSNDYYYMKALLKNTNEQNSLSIFSISDEEVENIKKTCKPFYESFYFWVKNNMTFFSTGKFSSPAKHFRWVYVSKDFEDNRPTQRILEAVEGARIRAKIQPFAKFDLSLDINLHIQKVYYIVKGQADSNGNVEIIVPYSTSYKGGNITTGESYKFRTIIDGNLAVSNIKVTEEAVLTGQEIEIPPLTIEEWGLE